MGATGFEPVTSTVLGRIDSPMSLPKKPGKHGRFEDSIHFIRHLQALSSNCEKCREFSVFSKCRPGQKTVDYRFCAVALRGSSPAQLRICAGRVRRHPIVKLVGESETVHPERNTAVGPSALLMQLDHVSIPGAVRILRQEARHGGGLIEPSYDASAPLGTEFPWLRACGQSPCSPYPWHGRL